MMKKNTPKPMNGEALKVLFHKINLYRTEIKVTYHIYIL